MRQIEIQGVVGAIEKGKAWIVPSDYCAEKQGCTNGCSSCGGDTRKKKIMVVTSPVDQFSIGESVIVRYYNLHEALGALIVFGIPLLCALTVLLCWYLINPATVESGRAILTSGCGFIGGFFIVRGIDLIFRKLFPAAIIPKKNDCDSAPRTKRTYEHG